MVATLRRHLEDFMMPVMRVLPSSLDVAKFSFEESIDKVLIAVERFECLVPRPDDQHPTLLVSRDNFTPQHMLAYGINPGSCKRFEIPERSWARDQCVGHSVSIDCDGIPRIIEFWSHAECPEHARDGNEKSSFCDMESRTNPSASTKVHMRPLSCV